MFLTLKPYNSSATILNDDIDAQSQVEVAEMIYRYKHQATSLYDVSHNHFDTINLWL